MEKAQAFCEEAIDNSTSYIWKYDWKWDRGANCVAQEVHKIGYKNYPPERSYTHEASKMQMVSYLSVQPAAVCVVDYILWPSNENNQT